jgi:valine dehydrogenase (NAD+)
MPRYHRPDRTNVSWMSFDLAELTGHEQIAFCTDPDTGLRAVIAIHDTSLGPALGGTRFHPYPTMDQALTDVLRLSRAMTSKNAVAGIGHGGGKAVIVGDPRRDKTPQVLRAYGRFVESLGGRYVTACDVGTDVADLDVVGEETRWATGRSRERGGAGDSSELTALGVFEGMRAAAQFRWGTPALAGRRVAIAGVGKVGRRLTGHLVDSGADVVITDVDPVAVRSVLDTWPTVAAVADLETLLREPVDVFSPNALGRALDHTTVEMVRAAIVCGGANNQLVTDGPGGTAERLRERGITYCPDFLVNAGGVIQVSDELHGFDLNRARVRTSAIFQTTLRLLRDADADRVTPAVAADRLVEQCLAAGGRRPWLPRSEPAPLRVPR